MRSNRRLSGFLPSIIAGAVSAAAVTMSAETQRGRHAGQSHTPTSEEAIEADRQRAQAKRDRKNLKRKGVNHD